MQRNVKIVITLCLSFIIVSFVSNRLFVGNTPQINYPFITSVPNGVNAAVLAFTLSIFAPKPTPIPSPIPTPTLAESPSLAPTDQPTSGPQPTAIPSASPTVPKPTSTPIPTVRPTSTPQPTVTPHISCPTSSGEHYDTRGIGSPDLGADSNPDTVMSLRGWVPSNGALKLVTYGYPPDSPPDPNAPQLSTVVGNGPSFSSLYRVLPDQKDNSLAGLTTNPNQAIYAPKNGYDVGGGYQYTVIYASPNELTMNVSSDDQAIDGYALHYYGFCVDPNLVSLYHQLDSQGRHSMPVLHGQQKVGVANAGEVKVAIRDSGTFMDPRSRLDWWKGY